MKKVYVVLTRTNTLISRLIRYFTKDRYTHAAISLDLDLRHMYSFGRRWTYNPFIGGFKHEFLDQGAYKFSKQLPGVIVELNVTEEQYMKIESILNQFINNPKYYKYNYLGLINNIIHKDTYFANRFLCSEFVYYVLNECHVVNFNKPRSLVRPQDFLNLDGRIIYEGDLRELENVATNAIPSPNLYFGIIDGKLAKKLVNKLARL